MRDRPTNRHAAVAGRVHQHRRRVAVAVGLGVNLVNLLGEALGRRGVNRLLTDRLGGVGVERNNLLRGRKQLRSFPKQRPAEVRVVNNLELLVVRAVVREHVADAKRSRARYRADLRPDFEVRPVEGNLVYAAPDADAVRCFPVHRHDYLRRRDVTDLAVQRQVHHRLVADIVDELVLARVPRERQAAAHQPFVETVEPAQAAPVVQVDVAWVDDLLHRRVPAQTHVAHRDIEHAHTAGRDHAKLQPTVVDLDQIDALLLAAVQSALVDRPAGVAPVAREIGARQLPALCVRVALGTCQNLIVRSRLRRCRDCQQTDCK